jgi:hypothetical protein
VNVAVVAVTSVAASVAGVSGVAAASSGAEGAGASSTEGVRDGGSADRDLGSLTAPNAGATHSPHATSPPTTANKGKPSVAGAQPGRRMLQLPAGPDSLSLHTPIMLASLRPR